MARLGLAPRSVRPARVPARARPARRRRAGVQAPAARVARRSASSPSRAARARAAALPAVACLLLGVAVAQPGVTTTTERVGAHVVRGRLRHRRLALDDGVVAGRARRPGSTGRDRSSRQLRAVRSRRPGRAQRPHRSRPALRVPDARRAGLRRDAARGACRRESPPPQAVSDVATSFEPLSALARDGFFTPGTEHRTCVLVTDGETRTDISWNGGCKLLVVRVGSAARPHLRGERQGRRRLPAREHGGGHGRPAGPRSRLGGRTPRATSAPPRPRCGASPTSARATRVGTAQAVHALAPFFAALALVAVALDLVRRYLRPAGGVSLVRRHRKDATVGV